VLSFVRATKERFKNDARRMGKTTYRQIGVYPETKHPTYHRSLGFAMEEAVVDALRAQHFNDRNLVFIQSFEVSNLQRLNRLTRLPLVQLINSSGKPYDFVVSGDPRTYADMVTLAGLSEIASYADGIGVNKNVLFPRDANGAISQPSPVIADAHRVGLIVHGWTFRAENQFLPTNFQSSTNPNAYGDLAGEITLFLSAGMDGFFTDHPNIGVDARDAFVANP
jgi:glycerophosphoryl diester phosphodiesterase